MSLMYMATDGRKLDYQTLEHQRIRACQRVWEGESPSAVMRSMGLCRTTIYLWLRREKRQGLKARKHVDGEDFSIAANDERCAAG